MSVVEFPKGERPPELLIGPFESWKVIVDGRAIPKLTGYKREDGTVTLTVDSRFGGDFPDEATAHQAAYLIANAMAIGAGYSHAGAESKDHPFAPRCFSLGPEVSQ